MRRTNGDNSASTSRVCRADNARRWVGNGREMVLNHVSAFPMSRGYPIYGSVCGHEGGVAHTKSRGIQSQKVE